MKRTNLRLLVLVVLLTAAAAAPLAAAQPVNERHPVAPGAAVSIENIAGSLVITGWDQAEVEITGTLGDGVEGIEVESDGEGISIEVKYEENFRGRHTSETELVIRVPQGSPLEVETVSASIEVDGVGAAVELESVSGAIRVSDRPEALDVETVSGSIDVASAPDGAELASVSGAIRVGSSQGRVEAENVSGSILVEGGTLGGGSFETVSGEITCKAVPGASGSIDMESMSGSITLVADAGAPASFELETFSGTISNQFGPEAKKTSQYTPEKKLRFSIGSGGPSISLSSFSGSIKLLSR
jgi:DUF4097 and DUF4098 domain-containing protein YvlB